MHAKLGMLMPKLSFPRPWVTWSSRSEHPKVCAHEPTNYFVLSNHYALFEDVEILGVMNMCIDSG